MDLDQEKFRASKADAHLEKPFDTEKLRNLVKGLVPKTQNHPLSSFLEFPDLPDFVESQKTTEKPVEMDAGGGFSPAPPLPPSPDNAGTWTMESFEPLNAPENESSDEFMTVDLPSEPPRVEQTRSRIADISQPQPDDDDRQWVQKTITQFKLPKEKTYDRKPEVKYSVPEEKISAEDVVTNSQWSRSAPPPIPKATEPAPMEEELELDLSVERESAPPAIPELNEKQIEAIIRAQSKDVIERVVWQVLPEIASRIIERELERLLKEREKL